MTRPNPRDPGVLDKICERLIAGEGINEICANDDMPAERTFYNYMANDTDFSSRIARAREAQQDAEVEKMVKMADDATAVDWQVIKLRIHTRQWRAARLAPKKYGDSQTLKGDPNAPLFPGQINLNGVRPTS